MKIDYENEGIADPSPLLYYEVYARIVLFRGHPPNEDFLKREETSLELSAEIQVKIVTKD